MTFLEYIIYSFLRPNVNITHITTFVQSFKQWKNQVKLKSVI